MKTQALLVEGSVGKDSLKNKTPPEAVRLIQRGADS
jgi:hypothetical protein